VLKDELKELIEFIEANFEEDEILELMIQDRNNGEVLFSSMLY